MTNEHDWSGRYFLMRKGYGPWTWAADDVDLAASLVFFNHWQRRLNPFRTLEEGDTIYLLDNDRRALAIEFRVAHLVRAPYETLQEGMDVLRAVYGISEEEDRGWPGYNPAPGPGFLLAYGVDVVAPLDIPFDFRWDVLGGRHGYISVDTFAGSIQIDHDDRNEVLSQLPAPGRPIRARAWSANTAAVINDELLARAPRRPTPWVVQQVASRAGGVCESEGCRSRASHFDHIVPWSKGGNSDLVNIRHLCEQCNLSKSDQMPDSYAPEQMWITFYACGDIDGDSITLGDASTAKEVQTRNSVYDVIYDDERMLVWKRGQRRVWCGADPGDRGLLELPDGGTVLIAGVDDNGEPIDGHNFLQTSPIEDVRDVPVDETLTRLGISLGKELSFIN